MDDIDFTDLYQDAIAGVVYIYSRSVKLRLRGIILSLDRCVLSVMKTR